MTKDFRGCRVNAHLKRGDAFSVELNGEDVDALIPTAMLPPGSEARIDVTYT